MLSFLLNKYSTNSMKHFFNLSSFFQINLYYICFQGKFQKAKYNYRPIGILSVIAKIFGKLLLQQQSSHFDNIFSKFQCSFRKSFGIYHCLLLMIKKWKKAVDNKKVFGALLTDLSKAFDRISHDLLIAKLHPYGPLFPVLRLIQDYLQNFKKRTKVGTAYINWQDIPAGVPQGSFLDQFILIFSNANHFWIK